MVPVAARVGDHMHGIARDILHRLREPAARQALDVRMRRVVAQQLHVARGQRHSVRFEQRYGGLARQPFLAGAQQLVQLVAWSRAYAISSKNASERSSQSPNPSHERNDVKSCGSRYNRRNAASLRSA